MSRIVQELDTLEVGQFTNLQRLNEKSRKRLSFWYWLYVAACDKNPLNEWYINEMWEEIISVIHYLIKHSTYNENFSSSSSLSIDNIRYSMGLKACEMTGNWKMGLEIVRHMEENLKYANLQRKIKRSILYWQVKEDNMHIVDDVHLYRRLFLLLGREGRTQEALSLLNDIEKRGKGIRSSQPLIDSSCYEAIITAMSKGI